MRADVGDRLIMLGRKVGDPSASVEVLEVRGADGAPPYRVRFADGHEGVYFPGSDIRVEHPTKSTAKPRAKSKKR